MAVPDSLNLGLALARLSALLMRASATPHVHVFRIDPLVTLAFSEPLRETGMAVFSSSPLSRGESHQCANNQHLHHCMSQPNSSGLMAGVEVLTRYSSAELPYACAFHAHYRTLGVHRILYIISDPEDFSSTASTLQETLAAAGHANGIVVPVFAGPNRALRLFDLSLLEAPYLLSIDMDEYINLQGSESSLCALIDSTPRGCMRIKWDISCCDFDNQSRRAAYPSPIFKMAAGTRMIKQISGPYAFLMADDLPSKDERTIRSSSSTTGRVPLTTSF